MNFRSNAFTGLLVRFAKDERGDITAFLLPTFVMLVFTTGLAIDLVRHEAQRADLQNALDRGVLAAASLQQTTSVDPAHTPEAIVNRYVDTRTFRDIDAVVAFDNVNSGFAGGLNQVRAAAAYNFGTAFLNLVGLPELGVEATANAREGVTARQSREISIVLDISASMARETTTGLDGTTKTRLAALREAASTFVTDLLANANQDGTSISLIPYSGHVNINNPASPMFDIFTGGGSSRVHSVSSCIEFNDLTDFSSIDLPLPGTSEQVPNFQNFFFERLRGQTLPFDPNGGNETEWGWCPGDDQGIIVFSNDLNELTTAIGDFVGYDGTGIQNGLKWGLGLLSSSAQPLVNSLVADLHVSAEFAGRPVVNGAAQKTLILMTDGRVRYQNRPLSSEYDTEDERLRFDFDETTLTQNGSNLRAPNTLLSGSSVPGDPLGRQYRDLSTLQTGTARDNDETLRQTQVATLCDEAFANNIRVITIAFGFRDDDPLAAGARILMDNCAKLSGDFFDVSDETELNAAFSQITEQLQALELTE